MLKENLLMMIKRMYDDDHEAYSNLLCSMMDYYGVNCLAKLSYEEMKEYCKKIIGGK